MATVLLLEPNKKLAALYERGLRQAGHQVFCQPDAQAALAVLDEQTLDVVILELQLPKHNGIEFLYEVRSYPDCDQLPVILHTLVPPGHPGLGKQYWPQLGIHDYLYKPQTSLAQLVERVNRWATVGAA